MRTNLNIKFNYTKILLVFVFLIPLSPFGVGVPVGFLNSLDVPKMAASVILIITLIFIFTEKVKIQSISGKYSQIGFYIFLLFSLGTIVISPVVGLSLKMFIGFLLLYFSGFILATQGIKKREHVITTIKVIKWVFLILSVLAIQEYFVGDNLFDPYRGAYLSNEEARFTAGKGRLFRSSRGPFASNLPFGYLMVSLFFINLIKVKKSFLGSNLYILISSLIGFIAIFFIQSRASYVVLVLMFGVYIAIKWRKHIIKLLLGYLFAILILFLSFQYVKNIPILGEFIIEHVIGVAQGKKVQNYNSNDDRVGANLQELSFLKSSPLIGRGFYFLLGTKAGQIQTNETRYLSSTDTAFYTTIIVDGGIIGSFFFFIFIIVPFWKIKNVIFNRAYIKEDRNIAILLLCSAGAFFICLLFSYRIESAFLPFFILGLMDIFNHLAIRQNQSISFQEPTIS